MNEDKANFPDVVKGVGYLSQQVGYANFRSVPWSNSSRMEYAWHLGEGRVLIAWLMNFIFISAFPRCGDGSGIFLSQKLRYGCFRLVSWRNLLRMEYLWNISASGM